MALDHSELKAIGERALREIIAKPGRVDVRPGDNADGHPAYHYDVEFDQGSDRAAASLLRTRLRQKIRDLLLEKQDAQYPYVTIRDVRP